MPLEGRATVGGSDTSSVSRIDIAPGFLVGVDPLARRFIAASDVEQLVTPVMDLVLSVLSLSSAFSTARAPGFVVAGAVLLARRLTAASEEREAETTLPAVDVGSDSVDEVE